MQKKLVHNEYVHGKQRVMLDGKKGNGQVGEWIDPLQCVLGDWMTSDTKTNRLCDGKKSES
jgi:hypothetical protein